MKRLQQLKILLITFFGMLHSCTELYEIETKDFESLLVVEATITDELKRHELKLSRTFRLEDDAPSEITNADVWIESSKGKTYRFDSSGPGVYTSINAFQAELDDTYTLNITLSDGSSYSSTAEGLTSASKIESIDASIANVNGEQGIQLFVNSDRNVSNAMYFKYEYEETYKIVVPHPSSHELLLVNVDLAEGLNYELELAPRTEDVSTCYSTKRNTDILLSSLKESQNTYVDQFPLKFISSDNGIIRDRYSILVTQYVQSFEAYNFYRIMKKLGTVENIFAENQPGFVQGNLSSMENEQEKVIGFFQVSSVSSKRIYFNYTDFGFKRPPYLFECMYWNKLNFNNRAKDPERMNDYTKIYNLLIGGGVSYYTGENPIYSFVSIKCVDCTSFSSNVIPEFWEE